MGIHATMLGPIDAREMRPRDEEIVEFVATMLCTKLDSTCPFPFVRRPRSTPRMGLLPPGLNIELLYPTHAIRRIKRQSNLGRRQSRVVIQMDQYVCTIIGPGPVRLALVL
jgi:hypothetical protein